MFLKKIYLNSNNILLKNKNKFDILKTTDKINDDYIINVINKLYKYEKKDILTIKELYNKEKIQYYLIRVNCKKVVLDYDWYRRFDMFKLNPESEYDDIFENILFFNNVNDYSKLLMADKYIKSYIKLEKIYETLIGEDIIAYN